MKLVISASSAGTVFEWYDFFVYGTLAPMIAAAFFPSDNPTLSILLTWAGFAIGFGFRPLGAILFGIGHGVSHVALVVHLGGLLGEQRAQPLQLRVGHGQHRVHQLADGDALGVLAWDVAAALLAHDSPQPW